VKIKNIITVILIIFGLYFILTFRDHNFRRAIDACVAGSQKLDKPMTIVEARKFCEEKILTKNK
tara:strand:+ start:201 stop:392 length:192 start_codon:yes stop_codon:yes gene_type:complete